VGPSPDSAHALFGKIEKSKGTDMTTKRRPLGMNPIGVRGLLGGMLCCCAVMGATSAQQQNEAEAPAQPAPTDARNAKSVVALTEIQVVSSLDQSKQPSLLWIPEGAKSRPTPLLVYLHSWSANYKQESKAWEREALKRGWIFLKPNFRGPNKRPEACGSPLARQDILDAMDHVLKNYQVDPERIYLTGASGGGHMTLLMAGWHAERFSAVSGWVGITDLAEWYRFHSRTGKPKSYALDIAAACGGQPGKSPAIDAQYKARSPIFHLEKAGDLPVDIAAGVTDGKSGSVPIHHSLRGFNVLATLHKASPVSEAEMDQLWKNGKLTSPQQGDELYDKSYDRRIFLRRQAGLSRVTIFDGGHEGLATGACDFLAGQRRKTSASRTK